MDNQKILEQFAPILHNNVGSKLTDELCAGLYSRLEMMLDEANPPNKEKTEKPRDLQND